MIIHSSVAMDQNSLDALESAKKSRSKRERQIVEHIGLFGVASAQGLSLDLGLGINQVAPCVTKMLQRGRLVRVGKGLTKTNQACWMVDLPPGAAS